MHLDGLIDTADGLGAGRKKQLEAMKDSRIGAIGLLVVLSIISIQIASLLKLDEYSPLAISIALFYGRFSALWAIGFFPYLQKETIAGSHQIHWKGYIIESKVSFFLILASISLILISPINYVLRLKLIISTFIGIFTSIFIPHKLGKILGGHNGDSYGACVVLVETLMLFMQAIILTAI